MILFIYFQSKTYNPPLVLSFFVISVFRIPTEYNTCFVNSLENSFIDSDLQTSYIPNSKSNVYCPLLMSFQKDQNQRIFENFVTSEVYTLCSIRPSPNSQTGGPFLVGRLLWLLQYIRRFTLYKSRPYPKPEDGLCCSDRSPLMARRNYY